MSHEQRDVGKCVEEKEGRAGRAGADKNNTRRSHTKGPDLRTNGWKALQPHPPLGVGQPCRLRFGIQSGRNTERWTTGHWRHRID